MVEVLVVMSMRIGDGYGNDSDDDDGEFLMMEK